MFKFRDNMEVKSKKAVVIPIVVANVKMRLGVEIVDNEIPLLISKSSMKKMGINLDFITDSVKLADGKLIKLHCSSSGHYLLPKIIHYLMFKV